MPEATPTRSRWFWINLIALCALAPLATFWFQQHLKLYFTEIVVVGGAFTLWALVRMVWGLVAKATKTDVWDTSRSLLSSAEATQWFVAAALLLAALWWSTGSLYLQLGGGPGSGQSRGQSGEYEVEVVRKTDGSPLIARDTLNAGRSVAGMPMFFRNDTEQLECRIVRPVEYEPLDCDLAPGKATRIAVPGDFKSKEYHLLRIVPGGALYRTLPYESDQPVTRYDMTIARGNDSVQLTDLRKQTVMMGALESELPLILRLHDQDEYEHFLDTRLRVAGQDRDSASLAAAVLSTSTRTLPGLYLKAGDALTITVTFTRNDEGNIESGTLDGFPITYQVTADRAQTLWLPKI